MCLHMILLTSQEHGGDIIKGVRANASAVDGHAQFPQVCGREPESTSAVQSWPPRRRAWQGTRSEAADLRNRSAGAEAASHGSGEHRQLLLEGGGVRSRRPPSWQPRTGPSRTNLMCGEMQGVGAHCPRTAPAPPSRYCLHWHTHTHTPGPRGALGP